MKEFNNNEEVSHIEIEGSIPYISSKSMNLILVDTLGRTTPGTVTIKSIPTELSKMNPSH